jgi:hypothetical protein
MIFYKDIFGSVDDFVIPRDYMAELIDWNRGHDWTFMDVDCVLTDYAKSWMLEKGIILKKQAALFKADPFEEWYIHSDHKIYDVGINFVVQGEGEMQWIDTSGATESPVHQIREGSDAIYTHITVPKIKVLDSWSGKCGIVNTRVAHRISTLSSTMPIPRLCLSFRPDRTKCDITFDKLYNLI